MFGSSNHSRPSFRPTLETLEDRCCPTTVSFSHGVLTITGDNNANKVVITQADDHNTLQVEYDVVGKGGLPGMATVRFNSQDVKTINFDLMGGNDQFEYWLKSDLVNAKSLNGDLGQGNDTAHLFFDMATIRANLQVSLKMDPVANWPYDLSAAGKDTVIISLGEVDGAKVKCQADLGAGDDLFFAHLNGDLKGNANVDLNARGGAGHDIMRVFAGLSWVPKVDNSIVIEPEAKLKVSLDGGSGADELGLYFIGKVNGELNYHLDGGGDSLDIADFKFYDHGSSGQVNEY